MEICSQLGLTALSLYAFSAENWKRPKSEIDTLMDLLREYIRRELAEIHRNNIRLQILGHYEQLPREVRNDLDDALQLTATNTGMVLERGAELQRPDRTGGRVQLHTERDAGRRNREVTVTEEIISEHLYTSGLARSRPAHPHQRGDAREQFPSVADRLRGDLGHGYLLARLYAQAFVASGH